jgi:hypothetical protein
MRIAMLVAFSLVGAVTAAAFAETTPPATKEAPNTTGRTTIPEKKEQGQPRGNEGSANTPADETAPAPRQGEPAAPAAPEGSTKSK